MKTTSKNTSKTANFQLIEQTSKAGKPYFAVSTEKQTGNFKALFELAKDSGFWVKILFIASLKKRCICIGNIKGSNWTAKEFEGIISDTLTFSDFAEKSPKSTKPKKVNKYSPKKTAINDIATEGGLTREQILEQIKALTALVLEAE